MLSTKLSNTGQIVIPQSIRAQYNLQAGQAFNIINTDDGILLQFTNLFDETSVEDVAGILNFSGKTISIEEMEAAIEKGALERKL